MSRARRCLATLLLTAALCLPDPALAQDPWTRTELYLGRLRPDGRPVTDSEWSLFLDTHVTPRFPEGLTVLDSYGQYRIRSGAILREPTKVLILVRPVDPAGDEAVRMIIEEYKRLFGQESVLRLEQTVKAEF